MIVFDTLGDTKDGSDPNGQDFLPLPHWSLDSMESTDHTLSVWRSRDAKTLRSRDATPSWVCGKMPRASLGSEPDPVQLGGE